MDRLIFPFQFLNITHISTLKLMNVKGEIFIGELPTPHISIVSRVRDVPKPFWVRGRIIFVAS